MTKEEFQDWRDNPVTQAVMAQFEEEVQILTDKIVRGSDHCLEEDAFHRGMLAGFRRAMAVEIDDEV